jgi:hypothetical protein
VNDFRTNETPLNLTIVVICESFPDSITTHYSTHIPNLAISESVRRYHRLWLKPFLTIILDTRILLTLLMDVNARPTKKDMKLWVDVVRFLKQGARGGALGFFTYMGM